MFNLLNFFFEGETSTPANNGDSWITWVIMGGMIVLLIVMMIIPQRKQKKAQEEMKAKLVVGANIMTIGGIIGEIVKMDAENIWIKTGLDEQTCILQFTSRAVHSVVESTPASAGDANQSAEEVVDEIK